MIKSEFATAPDEVRSQWLTNRLRSSGYLSQGEVVSVSIKASHKHHFALEITYSADAPNVLPRNLILKWYNAGYPYGMREGVFFDQIVPTMSAPPVPACYDVKVDWI